MDEVNRSYSTASMPFLLWFLDEQLMRECITTTLSEDRIAVVFEATWFEIDGG